MAQKKVRVYELARELGVENSVIIDLSSELKIGVKSHSSSIDEPSADRVRRLADSKGLKREPIVEEKPEPKKSETKKAVVSSSSRKKKIEEPAIGGEDSPRDVEQTKSRVVRSSSAQTATN